MARPFTVLALIADPALGRQVKDVLGSCADAVRTSESSSLAWTQLERQPSSLLLVDWTTSRGDREDLCRRVRMRATHDGMPILALVAEDDAHEVRRVLDAGADDFLLVPFAGLALENRIAAIQRRLRAGGPPRKPRRPPWRPTMRGTPTTSPPRATRPWRRTG
ncbi:MAG: response regulator [Burkholderiaceae bacterium]